MPSQPRRKPAPLDEPALYDYALRLLGRQMRTAAELTRLLRRRIEPGAAGEAALASVLGRLREYRYLDDAAYAQDFTRLRQENSSFGRRRVQQDLLRKGVHAETIATTLDAAYAGVPEEDLARRHLERKRIAKPANDREAARIARMLLRAGFAPAVVFRVLKQWDVADETLTALESEDPGEPPPD